MPHEFNLRCSTCGMKGALSRRNTLYVGVYFQLSRLNAIAIAFKRLVRSFDDDDDVDNDDHGDSNGINQLVRRPLKRDQFDVSFS